MGKNRTVVPVTISLPPDLAKHVRVLAAKQNKSRSQFIRELLERTLPPIDVQIQDQRQAGTEGAR